MSKITEIKVVESKTGHSCPKCGLIISKKSLVSKTTPVDYKGEDENDYTLIWDEIHKCTNCKLSYILHTGS